MIWRKIKTHWLSLGLFLLFACSCFGFLYSSKVSALENLYLNTGTTVYSSNYTSGPWNASFQATNFTGAHNWANIYDLSTWNGFNNNYVLSIYRYQGISTITPITVTFTPTDNYASVHIEFNWVVTQDKSLAEIQSYAWEFLDSFSLLYAQHTYSAVPLEIVDQNIQLYLTAWSNSVQSGPVLKQYRNTTLTVNADITLGGFTSNVTDSVILGFGTRNKSFSHGVENLVPNQAIYGTYFESGFFNIEFYHDSSSASFATQTNILNQQLLLQQQQYQQELQDREGVQDRSSSASDDGANASANAESATSSLLTAITGIYNQLLHPSITSCRVFGVQIYQLNLGTLDFCTGFDMPPALMAIGSIGMIGLVLLLGWSVLHATISLYNDLFGGKK